MINLARRFAPRILKRAASAYIVGIEPADALSKAREIAAQGFGATIGYWDDGRCLPSEIATKHLETLDQLELSGLDCALSVKLPPLGDQHHLVAGIVERAREIGVPVIFDSHAPESSDAIFRAMEQVGPEGVGCAIPGRWRRSLDDVERAIQLGIRVRVVKGEWPDPEEPDMDMCAGFLAIIDRLAGRATFVNVATHDPRVASEAIRRLAAKGTPCEQELLFPLPMEPVVQSARSAGIETRVYISFGSGWLPYSLSKFTKKPQILFWLMRDLLRGKRSK
ncbi:MAG: proline dehydrogenase [bacterium]|nr:proline dehydrogenase [bacterium]